MKSELSFLMDLFLNDEVPTPIKKLIAERMKEVEENLFTKPPPVLRGVPVAIPSDNPVIAAQSPSMQRIMAQHQDIPVPTIPAPVTPAAAMALQARAEVIRNAAKEKQEGRTSPRKF